MSRTLRLTVPEPRSGERLDRALAQLHAGESRATLQRWIRDGRVSVNGRPARASHTLRSGDAIEVRVPEPPASTLEPEAIALTVLYEDADLLVIDKPAGLVVHPGAGVRSGTLVHALLHRHPAIATVGGVGRPGVVHRLDRQTSGLMLAALTERAYLALVEMLRVRAVTRTYGALVWGEPRPPEGRLETAFGRDPRARTRMAVLPRGGRVAITRWQVTERFEFASRVTVSLETGRTHQIRVHMAHLGTPVIGDPLYGGRGKKQLSGGQAERSLASTLVAGLGRQALHAEALALKHPVTGVPLAFTSPWPEDMTEALDRLRAYAHPRPGP